MWYHNGEKPKQTELIITKIKLTFFWKPQNLAACRLKIWVNSAFTHAVFNVGLYFEQYFQKKCYLLLNYVGKLEHFIKKISILPPIFVFRSYKKHNEQMHLLWVWKVTDIRYYWTISSNKFGKNMKKIKIITNFQKKLKAE